MSEDLNPQIYLITPQVAELSFYTTTLPLLLDQADISCLRLGLISNDETSISKHADALREVGHARDISVVINDHYRLVEPLGLDGVHRVDGAKSIRDIRAELGTEAIVGAHCGVSKHTGMNAGEAGADYICFGPVIANNLNDGQIAEYETFHWWSEFVELPVIAEGGLTLSAVEQLAPVADFFALGEEIWQAGDDAPALLAQFSERLNG
ncbi:thiamine phosphate synthase [Amylibacter marinus]|uniref:Thiamine phosphate synthase n=1 Tax=Amylibacter marinus TaxID=1475483 RepID=A0ABQ5VXM2_9RHOB|nr:thiamine phosphate synthase [Amylibacter marinus]GLQ36037.1 thiamine phosphate synthase [Amylibacter marinus]